MGRVVDFLLSPINPFFHCRRYSSKINSRHRNLTYKNFSHEKSPHNGMFSGRRLHRDMSTMERTATLDTDRGNFR